MSIENQLSSLNNVELFNILSSSPVGMAISKVDGSVKFVNQAFCTLFGYTKDEFYKSNVILSHDSDVPAQKRIREQLISNPEKPIVIEKRYVDKSGKAFNGLLTISALKNSKSEIEFFIEQIIDISYRKKIEKSAELFRSMINASRDSMLVVDPSNSKILDVNLQAYENLGYSYEETLNLSMIDIDMQIKNTVEWKQYIKELREKKHLLMSSEYLKKDGTSFPVEKSVSYLVQDEFDYVLVIVRDITERKKSDELIWRQANFDALTNLSNRNMFYDRLGHALEHAKRNKSCLAVLCIDLDKFKAVNDTFGHAAGDKLLVEVGVRLNACVRISDTVARIGGDEFSIIMDNIDELSSVDRIAKLILKALSKPFIFENDKAFVSASIGIAFFPDDAADSDELMKRSDMAMYAAKNNGKNRFQYYTENLH